MPKTIEETIEGLMQLAPEPGKVDLVSELYRLLDGFAALPERERALPTMFALFEKYPEEDFGSPGPLVHSIEKVAGYESELKTSIRRLPTQSTVWMVNRILNGNLVAAERRRWIGELNAVREHPLASETVKSDAQQFLEHQLGREGA
jgi:hypothetical protein